MMIWYRIKYIGGKITVATRRLTDRLMRKIDDVLPTRKMKLTVFAALFAAELLLAYLFAVVQIGIWNGTLNIAELIDYYIYDDYNFPFLLYILVSVALVAVVFWILNTGEGDDDRNFTYSDSDVYGSAGEISEDELRKVGELKPIEELAGAILGQLDTTRTKVIGMSSNPTSNRNMIAFASPGQGKSFSLVKPQIVQAIRRGESVVCTDTKGELRADTIELARRYGYTIRNINLKYLKYSDGWHVLRELRCDDERAEMFVKIIMKNTGNPKDPHIALEEAVLKACCLYVERNPLIPPVEKTFYKVYSMVVQGPAKLDEIFASAKYDKNLQVAFDEYAPFSGGSEALRTNVIANLSSRIRILTSPVVQELTSLDEVDLTLPGRKKCIYYVTLSDQHDTMKFLASLFFTFLFLDLVDYADAQMEQRLPIPVNVILEEAANVGEIVGLTNYLSSARSRAIAVTLIFQGLTQIRKTYGDEDMGTILNDCFVHACLGTMEKSTAEHFEWLSGIATVKVKTEQHDAFESPLTADYRHSTGDGRRNVFTSNEVRKIQQGYIMLGWLGYDTIKCRTFGINQHPEYINGNMPKIHPMPAVPLANTEARAFLRAMEEQRVADYEAWENDGGYAWEGYVYPPPKCNGPSRGKPKPEVIPYPELEQMALEHSVQAKAGGDARYTPNAEHPQQPKPAPAASPAPDRKPVSAPVIPASPLADPAPASPAPQPTTTQTGSQRIEQNQTTGFTEEALPPPVETQPNAWVPMETAAQTEAPPPAEVPAPVEAPEVPASVVSTPPVYRDKKTAPKATQPKRSGSGTLYATKTIKREGQ